MPFPTTGLLDNFNRGNEGPPLSANWTAVATGHQVVGNAAVPGGESFGVVSMYNVSTYGADCEAYVTLATHITARMGVILRGTTLVEGTWDGYYVVAFTNTDDIVIERVDDDARTQLGAAVAFVWADGDKIGGEAIGGTIKGYIDDGGAGWAEKISRDDATYGAAGYVGIRSYVTAGGAEYDDFGGGTVGAPSGIVPIIQAHTRRRRAG